MIGFNLKENTKIIVAVELEKYVASIDILSIIVYKLSYIQKLSPIILYPIDNSLKIYLHRVFLSLSLAVYL